MKEIRKSVETYNNTFPADFNYSLSELMPCNKHPSASNSHVGICAYCLKERLVKLVCSDCGEQRLSSCSCSDFSSSYRNSCSTLTEVGSVGRISFLLENEKIELNKNPNSICLRRSNSSCVEVKNNKSSNGFSKIKKLFKKKTSKGSCEKSSEFCCDDKSETTWVSDLMGVSRSRSLCSFRGNNNNYNNSNGHNQELEGSDYAFSSAKISDVTSNETEHRKSGFRSVFDAENWAKSKSPIELKRVHKESDFNDMDESKFIDLNLDLSSESRNEFSADAEVNLESLKSIGSFGIDTGGSCRATVNERGLKRKSRSKSHKVWKWILRYNF